MNVYDFDKTIYGGDSTIDFYFFCMKKKPAIVLCIPKQLYGVIQYKLGIIDKTCFKEKFYCFLNKMNNIEYLVDEFWDINAYKVKKWYIDQHEETDVVISASPHFLLQVICKRLEIKYLLASNVNPENGLYTGLNCYGEEKVHRFRSEIGGEIDAFYSDSLSDLPMMRLAKRAYVVKGDIRKRWDGESDEKVKRV